MKSRLRLPPSAPVRPAGRSARPVGFALLTGPGGRPRPGALALAGAGALGVLLAGCPAPSPPPITPIPPDLEAEQLGQCADGEDETSGACTPEGCATPPEPEEGSGGAGAEDDLDCSRWEN